MKRNKLFALGALIGTFATGLFASSQPARAQIFQGTVWKKIAINFPLLHVREKDDPWISGKDEPYLIVTRFMMKMENKNGWMSIVPGTLSVTTASGTQNNLGHSGDGWADSGKTYTLPDTLPINVSGWVPMGEPYWVVGTFATLMEEDSYSSWTVKILAEEIQKRVQATLQNLMFVPNNGNLPDVIRQQIVTQIATTPWRLLTGHGSAFSDFIKGILSAINPDDFGGMNLIMAVTGADGSLNTYIGGLPQSQVELANGSRKVFGSRSEYIRYPIGDLSGLPDRARFTGNYNFLTTIKFE